MPPTRADSQKSHQTLKKDKNFLGSDFICLQLKWEFRLAGLVCCKNLKVKHRLRQPLNLLRIPIMFIKQKYNYEDHLTLCQLFNHIIPSWFNLLCTYHHQSECTPLPINVTFTVYKFYSTEKLVIQATSSIEQENNHKNCDPKLTFLSDPLVKRNSL